MSSFATESCCGMIRLIPRRTLHHVDYGVALLRRQTLRQIPADTASDLAGLYAALVVRGRMIGYEVHTRFYEIGTPASLEETRGLLQRQGRTELTTMSYCQ